MKYAIIGTGAVGGYYGSLLARKFDDVHFLLRSDFEHVKKHGLDIKSKDGDFRLPKVNAYGKPEEMPLCDVAVIALKTTQNDQLPNILPHVVKKDGIIIVLQNGLGVEDDVLKIMPEATIMGGLCFLCSNKTGPGQITHLDFGPVRIGQHTKDGTAAGITASLESISKDFKQAGIQIQQSEDLGKARWEKLVWNMAFNGVSVVLQATTDKLMEDPSSYSLIRDIMFEVIQGAHHCGRQIDESFAEVMLEATKTMAVYSPSMKLDFESGRELEVNEIYWRPIRTAEKAGYQMIKSSVIALQLDFINRQKK